MKPNHTAAPISASDASGVPSCADIERGITALEERLGITVEADDPMRGAAGMLELALQRACERNHTRESGNE